MKAIEFTDLSFSYEDGNLAIESLTAGIEDGECVAVVGGNGAGKTTLLNILAGFLRPASGIFKVYGRAISRQDDVFLRKNIGFAFQNPDDQLFMPTVIEDICFGPLVSGEDKESVREKASSILDSFGIRHLEKRFPGHLSGGEKRLAALAGILIMEPKIIAMDEPTAFLDPYARGHFLEVIKSLKHTRVFISHDLDAVQIAASRALMLNNGKLCGQGDPAALFSDDELMKRHRLKFAGKYWHRSWT